MLIDDDICYSALSAHDARFDGRFFVGVATTGIYCRPVCKVRTPKRENCSFYPSAAAAERAGFRPCLRCRPELAPGTASVDAAQRLAFAAAGLIEDGFLGDATLDQLAARLGVSDRHLRRVFSAQFGASPIDYAQTQRLLLAKRLLTDTALSVTDVAMAAGFGSLRRFNALFQTRYALKPSALRKGSAATAGSDLDFDLIYRPPYAWDAQLEFLAGRAIAGVEQVDLAAGQYRRTAAIARGSAIRRGWLTVAHAPARHALRVSVSGSLSDVVPEVLGRVKRLFDLGCQPDVIARQLGTLAHTTPGLRVPGAFDEFEMAVRAILGQQITVAAARTLAGRLAGALGEPVTTPYPELHRTFPGTNRIAALSLDDVARLGVIASRARAIQALARGCVAGELLLEPAADVERAMTQLRALPGIGEWTAQYIAMRALAWPDAFPHTDYGVKKAMGESSPRRVLERAEDWRPWRAYAALYLWRSLAEEES